MSAVLGADRVLDTSSKMGSEDFEHLAHLAGVTGVPKVYWFFGGMPDEVVDGDVPVPSNHSPFFVPVIEPTLGTGVAVAYTAVMSQAGRAGQRVGQCMRGRAPGFKKLAVGSARYVGGRDRIGQTLLAPVGDDLAPVEVTSSVLYDPEGTKRDG